MELTPAAALTITEPMDTGEQAMDTGEQPADCEEKMYHDLQGYVDNEAVEYTMADAEMSISGLEPHTHTHKQIHTHIHTHTHTYTHICYYFI